MTRMMALVRPSNALGRVGGGGGMRAGAGVGGRGGWNWHQGANRFVFVGGVGGGWSGWPYWWGGYPYWPYGGYPYGYVAAQPMQQQVQAVQVQAPCPTNVRLSEVDIESIRKGQSIRLTGSNQCGQAVEVTVSRMSSSQVSGLDGVPVEPVLGEDGGYGWSPFGDPEAASSYSPPVAVGEYEPPSRFTPFDPSEGGW